jgi:nitric oxide dioxygenase
MLSAQDRAIVKSTVPLLESGGEALITHFYRMMLSEYPKCARCSTRPTRPAVTSRVPWPMALMYARHIDQLDQLGDLVAKIINKHVALQILPEHYPIVGTCLLRAISEVLGDEIATPEVMSAWGAAYGQLADILIGAEAASTTRRSRRRRLARGAGVHRGGQGRGKRGNHLVLLRTGG